LGVKVTVVVADVVTVEVADVVTEDVTVVVAVVVPLVVVVEVAVVVAVVTSAQSAKAPSPAWSINARFSRSTCSSHSFASDFNNRPKVQFSAPFEAPTVYLLTMLFKPAAHNPPWSVSKIT